MSSFPHTYKTTSSATETSLLEVELTGRDPITASAPVQFGGPEGNWTPEDFFSASISSCFILTFKFLSRMKKLKWTKLSVEVDALLDKTSQGLMFNKVIIKPLLEVPEGTDADLCKKLLEEAEKQCLITKSIVSEVETLPEVKILQFWLLRYRPHLSHAGDGMNSHSSVVGYDPTTKVSIAVHTNLDPEFITNEFSFHNEVIKLINDLM